MKAANDLMIPDACSVLCSVRCYGVMYVRYMYICIQYSHTVTYSSAGKKTDHTRVTGFQPRDRRNFTSYNIYITAYFIK